MGAATMDWGGWGGGGVRWSVERSFFSGWVRTNRKQLTRNARPAHRGAPPRSAPPLPPPVRCSCCAPSLDGSPRETDARRGRRGRSNAGARKRNSRGCLPGAGRPPAASVPPASASNSATAMPAMPPGWGEGRGAPARRPPALPASSATNRRKRQRFGAPPPTRRQPPAPPPAHHDGRHDCCLFEGGGWVARESFLCRKRGRRVFCALCSNRFFQ